jgi:hypothetical protein
VSNINEFAYSEVRLYFSKRLVILIENLFVASTLPVIPNEYVAKIYKYENLSYGTISYFIKIRVSGISEEVIKKSANVCIFYSTIEENNIFFPCTVSLNRKKEKDNVT